MKKCLPKSRLVRNGIEIRKILQQGRKYQGAFFSLFCLSKSTSATCDVRAGFISPKRMGKAVERNRFRRQMREVFREQQWNFKGTHQILIMGRHSALESGFHALTEDFLKLCRRARLLEEGVSH